MAKLAQASVRVDTAPEAVWRALTEPELVKEYFFGTTLETDWVVGSPIVYRGEWQGKAYEDKGVVLEADRPRRLVSTYFSAMSGLPDVPENYQTVTYELAPEGSGTRLTVTQDNNRDDEAAEHSSANWTAVLDGLAAVAARL